MSTGVAVRLTEPVVYLVGGVEHERARRRRIATSTPFRTPIGSPQHSRPGSRAPSPPPGVASIVEGHFVSPSPSRGMAARALSPGPGNLGLGGSSRSASRSRITEGTTTGQGTREENELADEPPPAMLRGLLTLTLAKPSRIRDITVRIKGAARTDWPEGIGPRRLEVQELTPLIAQSWTLFSASDTDERRAASIGPGIREQGELDHLRGRSGSRRSASMLPIMPTRAPSAGLRFTNGDEQEIPATIDEREEGDRSALSRIPSLTQLNRPSTPPPPPVAPGEPSPAYESVTSSPLASPTLSDTHGATRPPNGRPYLSVLPPTQIIHARSPLGPHSPTEAEQSSRPSTPSADAPVRPTLSRDTSASGSTFAASISSTDESLSSTGEAVRGRSGHTRERLPELDESPPDSRAQSVAPRIELATAPSPASGITRRAPSTAPPPSARSASSRPSRFSLGALGEVLRGKSTSRVRDESMNRGRAESPDGRSVDRNESRGRKTALKVLRDRLTAGLDGSVIPATTGNDSDEEDEEADRLRGKELSKGWKEFRAGRYTYPISIPIPASLPPTILADFGQVGYTLKATVHRAGALTSNLVTSTEIVLVSCPGEDDTEESESIVVERSWENQLVYNIALSGKTFPIGGQIPISIRLNPLAKIKFFRFTVVLEQKTSYYGANRRMTRHEGAKKFQLLKIDHTNPKESLLPIISDSTEAIKDHPLAAFFINPTSSDDTTPSLLDPLGPWRLESNLKLPNCSSGLKFSTAHDKANITISHLLKVMLRVQRGDDDFLDAKGNRKLWDVIIETPVHILSCRCTQTTLPAYSSGPSNFSSILSTSTCCHDSPTSPVGRSAPSSSRASHSPAPVAASLEENLLFARLVAGEVTSAGEVPPSYDAVRSGAQRRTSSSSILTARGRTSARGGTSNSGSSPGSAPSTSRGRSESVDTIGQSEGARTMMG